VPLGRGAHRGLGHAPARYDVALTTERLDRISDYTPADMTVTAEAGVPLAELTRLLAREGQWLPIEPALPAVTTVGGLLATDLAGPLAAAEGRIRDFVIGIGVVTAAGVPARAGGRVVKNVAGYDLMKLFVGSLGTLAVVTDATFKVRPLPECQRGMVLVARGMAAALELGRAIEGALAVSAAGDLAARDRVAIVVVRLGGVAADVATRRARIADLAARHAATVELDDEHDYPDVVARFVAARDFAAAAHGDLVVRYATLPSRLPSIAHDALQAVSPSTGTWQDDPARGVLTIALAGEAPAVTTLLGSLTRVADAHGAHLVVERYPVALAPAVEVWHPLPAALPLMRRMKAALDPVGVLAPGRYVGRL